MAVTLTEAAKFTTNSVKRGVLETIIEDSIVMQKLPFIDVQGNALQYLQENTVPSGDFYSVNEVWSESTPDFTQLTAAIVIMGKDADIDNFLKATRSDKQDFAADVIAGTAKGVKRTFLTNFYYGDDTVNTKAFDGLHILLSTSRAQTVGSGSTPAALSYAKIEDALDLIRDGAPDVLLMPRAARTRINRYIRSTGTILVDSIDKYGNQVSKINGIPIYIDDYMTQTEVISGGYATGVSTGGTAHSIFAVRFGSQDLSGLQNGGLMTKKLGQLESKDAERVRVKWYCSLALFRDIGAASVEGATTGAVVA